MEENVFGVSVDPAVEAVPSAEVAVVEAKAVDAVLPGEGEVVPEPPVEPAPVAPVEDEEDDSALLAGEGEQGFRIGNKVYKDVDKADQVFRMTLGRVKAETKHRKEVEAERDWLRSQLEAASRTPQIAAPSAPPQAEVAPVSQKRLSDLVSDTDIDALIADKGPAAAFKQILSLVEDRLESRIPEVVAERTEGLQTILLHRKAIESATSLFNKNMAAKDASGQLLYPELDEEGDAAPIVMHFWKEGLMDPDVRSISFTDAGVRLAVREARAYLASQPQPASAVPAPVPAVRKAASTLQSMGGNGRNAVPAPGPTTRVSSEEVVRQIIAASQHPVFGVTQDQAAI